MMRYLPPNGTAGFARSSVRGNNRLPIPPARTNVTTLGFIFLAFRLVGFEDPRPWAQMTRSVALPTRYEFHLFALRQEAGYAHS